ncbi:MAG: hypothetical protein IM584_02490 [Chitinophagaceae bacterium]|nr:hypothetical protein [Chitinophagaceae bacterium]MCA6454476.1 hypothetical protein [Chitinophagaceae bacterium]MCA6454981.1 hypothetical protein [Chitinophagaceae bacterium]MCA6459879.1 hypothetical protein [Chitinophagaceae bacterium]MCA6465738.1 hypothetical protein [Chitinophagaceae bacterium]
MKSVLALSCLLFILITGCRSKKPASAKNAAQVSDTAKFYPLHQFFTEQIQYVDLRNFPIYQIREKDGKKDSLPISKEQFIGLAQVFLAHSLTDPKVKSLYKESVFQDLSTGSVTLNYSPADANAEVQNIDILLEESTNLVKRVFIRCLHTKGDTTIAEQCNWKANKSFQINRTITTGNGYSVTELNYINWNDKP